MSNNNKNKYSFENIEKTVHEKSRLSILTSLYVNPDGLSFTELKELCSLTDGNLSRHIQILNEAELVSVKKSFRNNKPYTHYRMTAQGRKRFQDYVKELELIVQETAEAEERSPERADGPDTGRIFT